MLRRNHSLLFAAHLPAQNLWCHHSTLEFTLNFCQVPRLARPAAAYATKSWVLLSPNTATPASPSSAQPSIASTTPASVDRRVASFSDGPPRSCPPRSDSCSAVWVRRLGSATAGQASSATRRPSYRISIIARCHGLKVDRRYLLRLLKDLPRLAGEIAESMLVPCSRVRFLAGIADQNAEHLP